MDAKALNLVAHFDDAAKSAERIAADVEARLAGTAPSRRSADETLSHTMGARAEDLAMMLRRESERARAGVDGDPFGSALLRLAGGFFAGALTHGARVGMATKTWDLQWLSAGDYMSKDGVEQERDSALAQIADRCRRPAETSIPTTRCAPRRATWRVTGPWPQAISRTRIVSTGPTRSRSVRVALTVVASKPMP